MENDSRNIDAVSVYGRQGASTRVRLYDWFDHLALAPRVHNYAGNADNQPGTLLRFLPTVLAAEVKLRSLVSELSDSTLIISKQASPFSSGHLEERLLTAAAHSVYDFDDALYAQDNVRRTSSMWSKRDVWLRAIRAADVVLAGSEWLAEEAEKHVSNVTIVPSCVEPDEYEQKTDFKSVEVPSAVWIGSPAGENFLLAIEQPLLDLNRKFGLRLTIVGGMVERLGQLEKIIDRQPWDLETFGVQLAKADLGIMPLPDNEFTRGKCSYKLLQYGAAGIPMVGSAVGANVAALANLGGLAAENSDDWYSAIASILETDAANRAKLGATARQGAVKYYSFQAWAPVWSRQLGLDAY